MSHPPPPPMSDAEREVLKVFWELGPLGVKETLQALQERGWEWTRSTVVTLLQRLVNKKYLHADRGGYAFVYRPLVSREDEIHSRMTQLAGELANGEPLPLVLAFAERHRFSAKELVRLEQLLDELQKKSRGRKERGA